MTRKAILDDLEELSILFDQYRVFYKKNSDTGAAVNFLRSRILKKDAEIFIAENDDRVLTGFAQLYPIFSSTRMARLWLLNDLFVGPEYRGQGISVALIHECKGLCRQTGSAGMILETVKDNLIGNNLYLKTGFLPDSGHNYYEWENDSA